MFDNVVAYALSSFRMMNKSLQTIAYILLKSLLKRI